MKEAAGNLEEDSHLEEDNHFVEEDMLEVEVPTAAVLEVHNSAVVEDIVDFHIAPLMWQSVIILGILRANT